MLSLSFLIYNSSILFATILFLPIFLALNYLDERHSRICTGEGTREWRVEMQELTEEEEKARELRGLSLRILEDPEHKLPPQSVTLQCGDMLYIPPR